MQDRSQMLAVIGAGPVGLAIAKGLKAHGIASAAPDAVGAFDVATARAQRAAFAAVFTKACGNTAVDGAR